MYNDIDIQMKQKEESKTFMMIKKNCSLGLYKKYYSAVKVLGAQINTRQVNVSFYDAGPILKRIGSIAI